MSLGGRIYGRLNAAQIDRKYGRLSPGRYYARLSQYFSVSMSVPWTFASMLMFVQCSFTMTSTFDVQPSSFDSSLLYTQLNQHLDAVERSFNAQENSTSTSASRDGFHPRGFRVEIEFGSDDETWFNANSHTPFLGSRFRRRSIQYPPPFNFLPSLRSPNTFTDQFKHTYPTQVQFNQQVQPMASVRLHLLVGFSTAPAVIPTKLNATHPSYAWNSLSGTATPPEVRSAVNQHLIENPRPRAWHQPIWICAHTHRSKALSSLYCSGLKSVNLPQTLGSNSSPNCIQDLRRAGHGGRYGLEEGKGMDGRDEETEGKTEKVWLWVLHARPPRAPSLHKAESAKFGPSGAAAQVWCRREGHAVRHGLGEGKRMDGGDEEGRGRTVQQEGGDAEPRVNERVSVRATATCVHVRSHVTGRGRGVRAGGTRNEGEAGWVRVKTRETRERWAALPEREFGAACTRLDGVRAGAVWAWHDGVREGGGRRGKGEGERGRVETRGIGKWDDRGRGDWAESSVCGERRCARVPRRTRWRGNERAGNEG
ncbi:hypothetical protein B0H16DRAFT_1478938 [Mycena metata]|uniref:Uncharacterized protein n=1 Tax=Mycena metata TaxID=1033252 RepID=A0AAD7H6E0_9AGAR|nr:hypothetical protein B0H16DRAFT_1478938 [Mycena metata]